MTGGFIQSWTDLYNNSLLTRTVVVFFHVGAIVVGGGAAISADRGTLKAFPRGESARQDHLREIAGTHRIVLISLASIIVTGLLQFFASVGVFLHSYVFWTKMGLVTALLINGAWLTQTESQVAARAPHNEVEWRRLRVISIVSLTLWLAIVFAGAALMNM